MEFFPKLLKDNSSSAINDSSTDISIGSSVAIVGGCGVIIFVTSRICGYMTAMNVNQAAAFAVGDLTDSEENVDEDPATITIREKGLLAFRGVREGRDYDIASASRSALLAKIRRSIAYMTALVQASKCDESADN